MIEDLKFHDDGGFDIEIVEIIEENKMIRVKTRCPFGEDSLGLSRKSLYLNKYGIPKWKSQVRKLLQKKYGKHILEGQTTAAPKRVMEEHYGKMNINNLDKI